MPGATVQGDHVKVNPLAGSIELENRTWSVFRVAAVVAAQPAPSVLALKSAALAPLNPTCTFKVNALADVLGP